MKAEGSGSRPLGFRASGLGFIFLSMLVRVQESSAIYLHIGWTGPTLFKWNLPKLLLPKRGCSEGLDSRTWALLGYMCGVLTVSAAGIGPPSAFAAGYPKIIELPKAIALNLLNDRHLKP